MQRCSLRMDWAGARHVLCAGGYESGQLICQESPILGMWSYECLTKALRRGQVSLQLLNRQPFY